MGLWIGVTANEVVGLLSSLGVFWNIPSTIMGLTFLAWANSIGDLVADVSLSRIGKARTAVSFLYPGFAGRPDKSCPCEVKTENNNNCIKVAACFGAPLLNSLVGTGIGCTAAI